MPACSVGSATSSAAGWPCSSRGSVGANWSGKSATAAGAVEVRALANRGLLTQALAVCEEAIAADKVDPGLQYLSAVILQELDRKQEAVNAFRRALYLDPDFVLAYFSLGNLLLHQEKTKAARKCFENVVSLLDGRRDDEVLPESEGLTAGRLRQIVHATFEAGALA